MKPGVGMTDWERPLWFSAVSGRTSGRALQDIRVPASARGREEEGQVQASALRAGQALPDPRGHSQGPLTSFPLSSSPFSRAGRGLLYAFHSFPFTSHRISLISSPSCFETVFPSLILPFSLLFLFCFFLPKTTLSSSGRSSVFPVPSASVSEV